MRQDLTAGAGTGNGALVAVDRSLTAMHDGSFLLGPGLIIGINSLLLAYLTYRSRLVPRFIAVLALRRWPAGPRVVDRGDVRALRSGLHAGLQHGAARVRLGDEPRRLPHRQEFQALSSLPATSPRLLNRTRNRPRREQPRPRARSPLTARRPGRTN